MGEAIEASEDVKAWVRREEVRLRERKGEDEKVKRVKDGGRDVEIEEGEVGDDGDDGVVLRHGRGDNEQSEGVRKWLKGVKIGK